MIAKEDLPDGLLELLKRLTPLRVNWDDPDPESYTSGRDRIMTSLDRADVTSSMIVPSLLDDGKARHVIALDIDHPAWLVPSSTPGHSHLYIDVPNGIPHEAYMALISLLGHLGVIEEGYSSISRLRGHTDLRLPWVEKGKEPGREPEPAPEGAPF